jgi:hypothetical protein
VSNGNEKFLSDIRNALGALTEADPYYADIPVITERLKDLQGRIDLIVGRSAGLALILVTPVVGGVLPNVQGANFTGIRIIGRVLENTKINSTGKEALDVAIYTAALWSQLKPDSLSSALRPDDPTIVLGNDPKYLSYDISFLTEGGTKIAIPQLAPIGAIVVQPFAATPVQAFNDGTRDYTWRPSHIEDGDMVLGRYVQLGSEPTDPDYWFTFAPGAAGGVYNESIFFGQNVGGEVVGSWNCERVDGVWVISEISNGGGATPPALPDGFEFFTESLYLFAPHPTPGAALFYTLDGSRPFPRNPTASLFLAPFNAASGTTMRARAWLPGYLPSAELRQIL